MPDLLGAPCNDFLGGQDASKIPDRVPENCYYAGINVSTKRGSLAPRWGYEKLEVTYPSGGVYDRYSNYRSYESIFKEGKFQALAAYPTGTASRLLVVISGLIFLFNINTGEIAHVPISDGSTLNHRASRINWSAASKYFVIFDYPNFPVIVDGSTARRSDPMKMEVPVSTIGAYNQNRLFIGNAGSEFTGGDPVGTLAPLVVPPITFAEIMTPASPYYGQIFQLTTASNGENITAMGFLQVSDTSTGIGPLLIGTEKAVYSYATNAPRTNWDQGQFGSVLVYNAGIVGPRALVNVNSDVFFLSYDGYVRTLSMSRQEQSRWARVPISRETEIWMKYNDPSLKKFGFVSYFNNKVFFSVNPYRVKAVDYASRRPIADYAHAGMVVLELDNVTSFGTPSKPTWAGLWTGVNPMDMVTLDERAFIISKDEYAINSLWEINPSINYDTADCKIRYVRSRIYTREYDFGDPFANKEVHSVDFNLDNLKGDVKIDVEYKPSHSALFLPWNTIKHKAPWRACKAHCEGFMQGFAAHMIRDLTIGSPTGTGQECEPATQELYQIFKKIMLRLTIEGAFWEIHEYRIKALPRQQSVQETPCEEYPVVAIEEPCNDDWCIGDFNVCPDQQTLT